MKIYRIWRRYLFY